MLRLQIYAKKANPINVGVYEEFPALDDALEWRKTRIGIKSRVFLLKNYGVSGENIIMHMQNDIITIEWTPGKKMKVSMLNSRGHCARSRMAN